MDLATVRDFAAKQLADAKKYSQKILFEEAQQKAIIRNKRASELRASISVDDDFASLDVGDGIAAWTAIAAIDLRRSTILADELGPRDTYLMTHTLLPTLAFVCEHMEGSVMNFRGDGLFASFGLKKLTDDDDDFPTERQQKAANSEAVACGVALIEATKEVVKPVLHDDGIYAELAVGVGVDCGSVVVTRVGWMNAQELTAYGSAVNHACKISDGLNRVKVSDEIRRVYPSGAGGRMEFRPAGDGHIADFPIPMLIR